MEKENLKMCKMIFKIGHEIPYSRYINLKLKIKKNNNNKRKHTDTDTWTGAYFNNCA